MDRLKIVRHNTQSNISTNVGENTDIFPIDLIIEILSRVPAKSIAICRAVCKQWSSLLRCPNFTELFLTRSLIRPRLLLALKDERKWHFFSCPQPHQDHDENVSVVSNYHMSFSGNWCDDICQSVRGLIFVMDERIVNGKIHICPVICNPSTGQQLYLPKPRTEHNFDYLISFLGYDPIRKQYKVLCMTLSHYRINVNSRKHQVLTLGRRNLSWRKIKRSFPHIPKTNIKGICINGVLYYQVRSNWTILIACFDVKSEKFSYIEKENDSGLNYISALMNYKGKLCALMFISGGPSELWVLNGTEKDKWSKHISVWPDADHGIKSSIWINDRGEISWVLNRWTRPLYVYYYNLETAVHRRVEIRGIEEKLGMGQYHPQEYYTFMDHVENLMFLS